MTEEKEDEAFKKLKRRVKQKKFNYLLTQYSDILGWSSKRE